MRHLNICVINAPKTGKTMTYIPAIASFIIEKNERYPQLLTDNGPIVIILCSSCNVAETVYAMIFEVMYKIDSKIKVSLAIPPLDRETLVRFTFILKNISLQLFNYRINLNAGLVIY